VGQYAAEAANMRLPTRPRTVTVAGMRFPQDVPALGDPGPVRLRAHREADVDAIVEQCTDPQTAAWTTVPVPYGHADAVEFVGRIVPGGWADGSSLAFAVEYAGRFAGSVDLRHRSAAEAEIGFGLHPAARGQGVMHRAVGVLLDWAFAERGYTVVTWRAQVGNWPSRRVAWAAGFRFGPTVPELLEQRGRRRDAWTAWIHAGDDRRPKSRWLQVPVLTAGDLRLRAWQEGDGDRLVDAANDARLRRYIPRTPLPMTAADVAAYLLRVRLLAADGARLSWCVADRQTDDALGNVALFEFEADGSAQLGYWAHPKARGQGVLSRATRTVADWALTPAPAGLGLRRLYLLSAVGNSASRRVAEAAGFTHVGTEQAGAPVGDGYEDSAVYDRLTPSVTPPESSPGPSPGSA
jgi:RimJ/RimL family protein N-acetyltransferase